MHLLAEFRTDATPIIEHLGRVQSTRIAVVYQNNSCGQDALAGYEQGLAEQHISPVVVVSLDGAKPEKDVAAAIEKVVAANPQAMAIAGPLKATAEFIRGLRTKGSFAQSSVLST
jgi:ABC-type branched-subunit amino acid transport system substrate-binding protein